MQEMHKRIKARTNSYQILAVDDSKMIRLIESRALEGAGFQVETAENGVMALEKALANPPDLILLDINMPEMDGWEVLRRVRSSPALRETLVVILSSNVQQADVQYAQTLGVHSYLMKPVTDEQLVAHLRATLNPKAYAPATQKPLEACRILIVDDSTLYRKRAKMALEGLGCELLETHNGKQACHLAAKYRPDLILMDINMPKMDGLEATRWIRKNPLLQRTVIVAMTSSDQRADVAEAMEAGMNDYIVKPFSDDLLLKRITHHLKA